MNPDREAPSVQVEPDGRRPPGVRDLDRARALELLAGTAVGRVVYTVGALPAVLPVRFRLDPAGGVLLSALAGSELARAVDGAVIAFEVDELDGADGTGWCVTVLGRAEVRPAAERPGTAGAEDRASPRAPADRPAAAGAGAARRTVPGRVVIRIGPELVVGRRLTIDG
ncbi:pyridoxamine 5'-phosphate oxidase family protein [Kitasatospora sp. NPDC059327]|uniref:pyridoxamine 5'-phosphate oxidase family protein n=1 Tax=Kitasatospora sp. NPDC059327 TaxID=3346803 RepID=UPI003685E754